MVSKNANWCANKGKIYKKEKQFTFNKEPIETVQ